MDQESFETLTLARRHGRRRSAAARRQPDRPDPEVQRQPDRPAVAAARRADGHRHRAGRPRRHRQRRRDQGRATLETGLEIRVPLFIKEGERVKVHTETREFAGRA